MQHGVVPLNKEVCVLSPGWVKDEEKLIVNIGAERLIVAERIELRVNERKVQIAASEESIDHTLRLACFTSGCVLAHTKLEGDIVHFSDVEVVSLELVIITSNACQVVDTEQHNLISILVVEISGSALVKCQVGVSLFAFTIARDGLTLNMLEREVANGGV